MSYLKGFAVRASVFGAYLALLTGIADQREMAVRYSSQVVQLREQVDRLDGELKDLAAKEAYLQTPEGETFVAHLHGFLAPDERSLRGVGMPEIELDVIKLIPGEIRWSSPQNGTSFESRVSGFGSPKRSRVNEAQPLSEPQSPLARRERWCQSLQTALSLLLVVPAPRQFPSPYKGGS